MQPISYDLFKTTLPLPGVLMIVKIIKLRTVTVIYNSKHYSDVLANEKHTRSYISIWISYCSFGKPNSVLLLLFSLQKVLSQILLVPLSHVIWVFA